MAHDSSSAPDLWSSLEDLTSARTYEPGAMVFQQGQPADGVYLIQKGEVRIWMPERSGQEVLAASVSSGTMLALSEVISEGTHKLSAQAVVQSEIGFVSRATVMQFLRDHHQVCLQVVRVLSEDLQGLYHQFQALKVSHSRARQWKSEGGVQ